MSDIVERLREAENDMIGPYRWLMLEAADEIEQLQARILEWEKFARDVAISGEQQKAEIERLQEQCAGLAHSVMCNGQDLLLKEAEIERLRAENAKLLNDNAEVASMFCDAEELRAENERLTAQLNEYRIAHQSVARAAIDDV